MRITALTPQKRRSQWVNVFVDGEFRLTLPDYAVEELGLCCDEPIDEATLERAAGAETRARILDAAFALLNYRARTAAELTRRLVRKGFPAALVDGIVVELTEYCYLDDYLFALDFVRDRTRNRPRGRYQLAQELRARGVAVEVAWRAIEAVVHEDDLSDEDLARAAAESWLRKGGKGRTGPDARRRLYGFLARRGFFGPEAHRAMDAVLPRS